MLTTENDKDKPDQEGGASASDAQAQDQTGQDEANPSSADAAKEGSESDETPDTDSEGGTPDETPDEEPPTPEAPKGKGKKEKPAVASVKEPVELSILEKQEKAAIIYLARRYLDPADMQDFKNLFPKLFEE